MKTEIKIAERMTNYKRKRYDNHYYQRSEHVSDDSNSEVKLQLLIDGLLPNLIRKCSFETELKETYIWSGASLENKIKNHILILGFVEGLDYYIESIRWESGIPIIIVAEEMYAKSISKIVNKYDYLYYYVDNPTVADVLKKVNIKEAYHVLILSNPNEK